MKEIVQRPIELDKIRPFLGKPVIKVLTGMRRVGKSSLLLLLRRELESEGIPPGRVFYINKESLEFAFLRDHLALHEWFTAQVKGKKGPFHLLIDEVQEIAAWEKALVSLFSRGDVDLTITGSNARMLSSDLATLLSGRYVELPVHTLSFTEFKTFTHARLLSAEQSFTEYLALGGLPGVHPFDGDRTSSYQYLNSILDTIILRDVIERYQVRNVRLLENLVNYLFEHIGATFSAKRISDYLRSQKQGVGVETVLQYLSHLSATYAVHRVPRYDVAGRRHLEINEKYYLGDTGLRHARLGFREGAVSAVLENLVFLELRRRGYRVSIGKLGAREIDFIAERQGQKVYVQVAYLLATPETIEREFSVLADVPDQYPKYVLSLDREFGSDVNGIRRLYLPEFLAGLEL